MVLLAGAADDDERAYQGLTTQMRHKTTVATPATTTHPSFAPLAPHIELLGVANVSAVQLTPIGRGEAASQIHGIFSKSDARAFPI
jgi:hypothetical protein